MRIIGIDLGGTKILGVRADERGNIEAEVKRPTGASDGLDAVVERIASIIEELTPEGGVDAIGAGVPGPLNAAEGMVYDPPNLPGWHSVHLTELLYKRLDPRRRTPIVLVNDANAAGLAEYRFGAAAGALDRAGRPVRHLVYLTISTGVGGGVIIDGKLFTGSTGMAGELGHIVVDLNGPRCPCGQVGCLEAMASGPALARDAAMLVSSGHRTWLEDITGNDPSKVTPELVVQAAHDGDPMARELMEREGTIVGAGVATCIHAFNPQLVVIGGGLSNADELLFAPMRKEVDRRVMPAYRGTFEIVKAALKGESGALGAVAAAMEALGVE